MALLQIAEPGQSAVPHQHKLAVGIDLGTTNSLVATVRSGKAVTLADHSGDTLLPSVVRYHKDGVEVGKLAKAQAVTDPHNTITSVKRLLGKDSADIDRELFPYNFSDAKTPHIQTVAGDVNPIQVSAEILKSLAARAEESLQGEPDGVVITVPAYFDDAQRQGTKDAAQLAGLHVLRLLNEPTAAAIAYGLDSGDEGVIAIYDLGGGTFDISILRLSKGVFQVLATGGDSALGGDDFDDALVEWIAEQAQVSGVRSAQLQRELSRIANQVKVALTDQDSANINLDIDGINWQGSISRELFDSLIESLVKRTIRACRRALRDAEVELEDVNNVVMVGGSTRVPKVRSDVANFFDKQPLTNIDPDQVVAIGAAIQADTLVGNKKDGELLLLDVTPLSLGIETMGGLVEKVIPRNTTIPVARAQEFTTFKDGQTAMAIRAVQGERELVDDCRSLAKFALKGIPPLAAGAAHIRVTFQVDADGLLSVTAMEKSTGVQSSVEVKPSYGLADEEVARMLKDSITNAKHDVTMRMLREQQVEAARFIEDMSAALVESGERLLQDEERLGIEQAMQQLQAIAEGDSVSEIEQAIKYLDSISQDFAARRMDDSIKQALRGQQVDRI
ncbi:Fe-S protein assembly chaperone HscA [Agarivorans sp. B2Z047]|uniref:Fe-S protein assembly chaperone HscA n=1 Tax=Agarivorans sp. B2Z047 TaxID=2652721 RepID=UPI00128BBEF0|nr:Fe-S protein assembly chaperone HscA [Agarivorans sp. B2Z047]MPW27458.1 Fe-S protein assembly chaperone HscA [Agarivorans sp. B2Z047]UQN44699.1 Fe-S protein assembly chaperone HscA [Agarivorans sp. B2Z047]